jgi:hypothetical protein
MATATSIVRLSLESNKYEQGLRGAKKQFEDFAASIGINMKKLTAYGLAAGAAATAINKMTSEISDCIRQSTELAKQGEGVRMAFQRLNQAGLLNDLREATHGTVTDLNLMKAAVQFQDFKLPLSELGTMLAFAQQKAKDTGQSVDYLVNSIVTGLGRKSKMILDNLGISATEIDEKMKKTGDMTKAVGEIVREQMAKAGDYVETAADRAAQANTNLQNKMEELGRKFAPLEEASNNLWTSMKIGILGVISGPLTDFLNKLTEAGRIANQYGVLGGSTKVGRLTSNLSNAREGNRQSIYKQQQAEFWKYINKREQYIKDVENWQKGNRSNDLKGRIDQIRGVYGILDTTKIRAEVDAAKRILSEYQQQARAILSGTPTPAALAPDAVNNVKSGVGKSGKTSTTETEKTELQTLQSKIQELEQEYIKLGDITTETSLKRQGEIRTEIANNQKRINQIKLLTEQAHGKYQGGDVQTTGLGNIVQLPTVGQGLDKLPDTTSGVKDMTKALQEQKQAFNLAGQAASSFGAALSGIEDPGAKAAGAVVSAIASIALSFAQAAASPLVTSTGWGWLPFLAAGAAAMATTISTIHSLTGYAEGGIVKGNSYSGDNILANGGTIGLNAGEVVLTKAMQGNLASQLQGGGLNNLRLDGVITGENIHIVHNRYLSRTGQGELVTW